MSLTPLNHDLGGRTDDAALAVKQKPLRYVVLDVPNTCLYVRMPLGNCLRPHEAAELAAELTYAVHVLEQMPKREPAKEHWT